jgi:methionyl-tRNA synthetase
MSKTADNVVNPIDFIDRYGVNAFRYFLMTEMSLGQDAGFTEDAFVRRYNTDLANDLGNLLSRVLTMINSYCGGRIPQPGLSGPEENELAQAAVIASAGLVDSLEAMRVDLGLVGAISVVREANRYLERKQPWTLGKEGKTAELATVLYAGAEALRIISGLLHPVMPAKMEELRTTLGLPGGAPDFAALREWGKLAVGQPVGQGKILFPRIVEAGTKDQGSKTKKEASMTTEQKPATAAPIAPATAPAAPAAPAEPVGVAQIAYADFTKVQMRTARVLAAEKVAGADRLLKVQVELGAEQRQIVAGIAAYYTPEALVGRIVVVVTNLKPAKIRGVESNGMLLAASTADSMRIVTVDGEFPVGSTVK